MKIFLNKRYNGTIPIERNCNFLGKIKFNFLFSFKFVEDLGNDEFLIDFFNPQLSRCLLSQFNNFTFYYKENDKNFIVNAKAINKSNSKIIIKVDKNLKIPEKRRYDRFKLTPGDLPYFSVYYKGKLLTEKANIIEISLRGLQILAPDFQFSDEYLLEIKNEKKNINIELVKPEIANKEKNKIIIRGEIQKTNVNMTKLVIETYIKIAKNLINTYCKKG